MATKETMQKFGCITLHEAEVPLVDFVFVHGLNGDPRSTWTWQPASSHGPFASAKKLKSMFKKKDTSEPESVFWPVDFLASDFPNCRISTFGYDASVSVFLKSTEDSSIYGVARDLVGRLTIMRRETEHLNIPIIFIAHSLGGIVVKEALKYSQDCEGIHDHLFSIYSNAFGVIFFGTPHRGSGMASMGEIAANIAGLGLSNSQQNLLHSLREGSPDLQRIADNFGRMLLSPGKGLKAYSFSELVPITGTKFVGKVVDPTSSIIGYPQELRGEIHANHMNICKFPNRDEDYQYVDDGIKRWVREIKGKEKQQSPGTQHESTVLNRVETLSSISPEILLKPDNDSKIPPLSFREWPLDDPLLNVPSSPTPHFTGRTDKLQEISQSFQKLELSSAFQRVVVLYGLGGAGKTQIALSYLYKNQSTYSSILWIDATSEHTILRSFRQNAQLILEWAAKTRLQTLKPALNYSRIAMELGLKDFVNADGNWITQDADNKSIADALVRWLEQKANARWLVVFDAADQIEDLNLKSYFPKIPNGDILITSRRRQASALGVGIGVDCLEPEDAAEVVMKFAHIEAEDLRPDCQLIAQKLEYLALPLAHAGSYIFSAHISPGIYLKLYETQRDILLRKDVTEGLKDYRGTVLTTWEISYAFISKRCPEAAKFLIFVTFLDPENLQYSLFRRGITLNGPKFCNWMACLQFRTFSQKVKERLRPKHSTTLTIRPIPWLQELIGSEIKFSETIAESKSKDGLHIHAVVRDWCQLREPKPDIIFGFDAICLVGRAMDTDLIDPESHDDWDIATQGALHVSPLLHFLKNVERGKPLSFLKDMNVLSALTTMAGYIDKTGESSDAVYLSRLVYEQLRQILGANHRLTVIENGCLSDFLDNERSYDLSEPLIRERIRLCGHVFPKTDSLHWQPLQDLGTCLARQEKYKEALVWLEKAYVGYQKFMGYATTDVMVNLAYAYISVNEFEKADQLMHDIRDPKMGANTRTQLSALRRLAFSAVKQERISEGIKYLREACDLTLITYGAYDPMSMINLNQLRSLLCMRPELQNQHREEIEKLHLMLIEGWANIKGRDSIDVAILMEDFASFLDEFSEPERATQWHQQAAPNLMSPNDQRIGPNNLFTYLKILNNWGKECWEKGDLEAAERYWEKAAGMPNPTGLTHMIIGNLGILRRDQGRFVEAEELLKQSISLQEPDEALLTQNNLASTYYAAGKYQEASMLFQDIIARMKEVLGEEHPHTLRTIHNYALFLENLGDDIGDQITC